MRIPIWQKWLSYITPLTLEETGTDLNPELTVRVDKGRLQLLSGNAIYSWDDLYRNFTLAFAEPDLRRRSDQDVLLLGLGLGSVPFMLEKTYGHRYYYTAVEWDEAVAELALRYTLDHLQSPTEVIVSDAEVFVEVCADDYDMIVVDIFEDHKTPPQFETVYFLENCANLLRKDGVLLYNRLYHEKEDRIDSERFFEEVFREVFPESRSLDTDGNLILIGRME